MGDDIKRAKQAIREKVWRLLEEKGVARFPRPVYGRIPNFAGAEEAARRLARLSVWRKALVIKVNPDSPQKPVRALALYEGKTVIMATPRLKAGFIILDPSWIPSSTIPYAASIKGAFRFGKPARLKDIPKIDLVVTGCVAVDKQGRRLGKGGGYAELEYAILREIGAINEETPVVATIHDLQIVDEIPFEEHDLALDVAITPTKNIWFKHRHPRPKGVIWGILGDKAQLPPIRELAEIKKHRNQPNA